MISFFENHNKLSWAITIFGAIAIFALSSRSFDAVYGVSSSNLMSNLYHFLAFFLLAFFLFISSLKGRMNKKRFFLSGIIVIVYGILDEVHQYFVPGRFCSFNDVLVDTAGIITASIIYFISIKVRKNAS